MIKVLKLQKAVIAIILGVLGIIAYVIMSANDIQWGKYVLEASGLLFMLGALLFLYPILFGRKDKDGCVELDPEAVVDAPVEKSESQA
ncbi:MAG: isoleucyl-tRNA synthetase [Pedobacter sp.]|nr:isoleucyl-tRNA synthetase [Pedobacter sp.]